MNIVEIDRTLNEKERQQIAGLIKAHNDNLFDANDYVEEEIEENCDFTQINGGDSYALASLFSSITAVLYYGGEEAFFVQRDIEQDWE